MIFNMKIMINVIIMIISNNYFHEECNALKSMSDVKNHKFCSSEIEIEMLFVN
jgi:hypothetical protein